MPQIEVTFDIDANGILSVKAKDKGTGKEQSVRIEASSGLSKDDIERMKQDAAVHADEDKKKRDLVEARNIADTMIYTTEKAVRDAGDKIPEPLKKEIEDKKKELDEAMKGDDAARIRDKATAYSVAAQKVGELLYKKEGEGTQGTTPVEHEEIKDDNKSNESTG
jgi:molecular chaperone DnaK